MLNTGLKHYCHISTVSERFLQQKPTFCPPVAGGVDDVDTVRALTRLRLPPKVLGLEILA